MASSERCSSNNYSTEVGNALTTTVRAAETSSIARSECNCVRPSPQSGMANIVLDLIPTGTYTLLFVNSSNYALDREAKSERGANNAYCGPFAGPQVYHTSAPFEIKSNGSLAAVYSPPTTTTARTSITSVQPGVAATPDKTSPLVTSSGQANLPSLRPLLPLLVFLGAFACI